MYAFMSSVDTARPLQTPAPVAMQHHFEIAIYLIVFTGFGTIASSGRLDTITVLMVSAALLFRGYLLIRRRT